jgi:hypothetical protein
MLLTDYRRHAIKVGDAATLAQAVSEVDLLEVFATFCRKKASAEHRN